MPASPIGDDQPLDRFNAASTPCSGSGTRSPRLLLQCRDLFRDRPSDEPFRVEHSMNVLIRSLRGPLTTNRFEPYARAVPVLLYMAVIFFGSSVPGDKITISFDDRIAHFLEYAIFGGLLLFFAASLRRGTTRGAMVAILAFVAIHALADEFHQSFVPLRDSSAKDWCFDLAGASTALLLLRVVTGRDLR